MSTAWKYKTTIFLLALVLSIYLLIPTFVGLRDLKASYKKDNKTLPWYYSLLPDKELNLGLDLRGGLYMELEVGIEEALTHQIDFTAGDIRRMILSGDLESGKVSQIPGYRLRIELQADKLPEFKQQLVRYFGNQMFNIESKKHELFLQIKGDDKALARKKAFEAAGKVNGFLGVIDMTHSESFLAIPFQDDTQMMALKTALQSPEYASYFEDKTDLQNDALYLQVTDPQIAYMKKNIIEQAANSARNRIDRFGVAEASVSRQSSDRLVVELPGVKDPDSIIDIVKRTGKLEFRLVDETIDSKKLEEMILAKKKELNLESKIFEKSAVDKINEALKAELPPETEIAFRLVRHSQTQKVVSVVPFLLEKKAEVTGDMLDNASVQTQQNMPYVSMSFDKTGAKKFGDLTSKNVGRYLAIVLDGAVTSAPVIKSAITGGQAQIELGMGRYDVLQKEASELVLILKEGALPASLNVATKNIIGPSLGQDSIEAGLKSLLIAALAVILFMLVYYKVGGVVANLAMLVNVVFIFGILTLFQASLTLPGIAGIVLTMGMAVDANVIIFERMREEMFLGQKPALVVESGYSHAMSAIVDGNITTFISGLVLFEFGTGPIKGFATTLMIGIVTTMITAIILTRVIYDWMVQSLKVKTIKI